MFISIPKEFFVPVVFSEDFRYNSENDSMEYDNSYRSVVNSRESLYDYDYRKEDEGFTAEYMENLINIDDKLIEEQVSNFSKNFLKLIEVLKNSNCLDPNKYNIKEIINFYANNFRDLYNDYKQIISNVSMPISESDKNQIIDKYIGDIEDMYNKALAELNCKNINLDVVEGIMDDIFNDARDILVEEIRNINCELVNVKSSCKSEEITKNNFNNSDNIYAKLDNEFLREMKK